MSRSDRIVNILLALAWVLLIVRVGRIYMDGTSSAVATEVAYDDPVPSPIVLVRRRLRRGARGRARVRACSCPASPPPPLPADADVHHGPAGAAAHCGQVPLFPCV